MSNDGLLKPLFARVLLEREEIDKTKGGIILPDSMKDKRRLSLVGKVLAVGPACDESIKVGKKVVFGQYSGTEVKLRIDDNDKYFICQDEDILAILPE